MASSIPAIFEIIPMCLPIQEIYFGAEARVREIIKNGIEIPREYTNKSTAPPSAVWVEMESARIDPNIAPTHGVQTIAKTNPKKKDLKFPSLSIQAGILNCF